MKKDINNIPYEFITVEWIYEQLQVININDDGKWNDSTKAAIDTYNMQFAKLIYNLFKRGLGIIEGVNSEYAIAGFDFNIQEVNDGKGLNKTDLQSYKEKVNDSFEGLNNTIKSIILLQNGLQEILDLLEYTLSGQITAINSALNIINNERLSVIRAYDISGNPTVLPIACDGNIFILKYGCKELIVGPYWQLESVVVPI
jgi:hypothetical protein